MKKGQSALEYLMTYGWAILIVIIVGAALYSMGIFNPSATTGKTKTGFTQIDINDWKYDTSGTLIMVLENRVGGSITLTSVDFTGGGTTVANTTSTTVAAGKTATMQVDDNATPTVGDGYELDVTIAYTKGAISHTETGTLIGNVE